MDVWKTKQSEALEDRRRSPRWVDGRLAFVRTADREQIAVTGDISLGGMQLALVGDGAVPPGPEVTVDVAFEKQLLEIRGRVAYSVPKDWGRLVGVCFEPDARAVQEFLSLRYECSLEGAQRAS